MNFKLNSEQQLLQDSVRRFVDRAYGFEARAALVEAGQGGSRANWQTFAENGWLAAAIPEDYGGLGGTAVDTALIAGEFGRGLVIEPYLGCAVLAPQTLAAASTAHAQRVLPAVAAGTSRLALAYSEIGSRGDPAVVATTAAAKGEGYVLDGRKTLVLGGADADHLIVSAQLGGVQGVSLFLLDASSAGLTRQPLPLHDGSRAAEIVLERVHVASDSLLGKPGSGLAALEHGIAHAVAALGAELVGAMGRAIELTADYLKVRQQFGVPIGSFQALQHRMADMAAEIELSRSMLFALLASIENDAPSARRQSVSQAKSLIGRAARYVCGQAIQLHGGIGMTDECSIGHYFKRAIVAEVLFGSSDQHEAACAAALQRELSSQRSTV